MQRVNIPEINTNQLGILIKAGEGNLTMFWIVPDPVKDTPDEFVRYSRSQSDIDKLIEIGLMIDTSKNEDNVTTIQGLTQANGRVARATTITNWGMLLFGHICSTESQMVN